MKQPWIRVALAVFCAALLVACGGPEAKKLKFFNKGKAYFDKGDYVRAKLELKNAIQIDPKYAAAYQMSGMIALRENDIKGAFGLFSKAVELDPGNRAAQFELGKLFLAVGQPDKAEEKVALLLKQDSNNGDALQLKGAIMVSRKEFRQAADYLESLISRGVKAVDVYFLLATCHLKEGDQAAVEKSLRRGIEANSKSVLLHLTLADLLARQKKIDEAAALLQRVIDFEPGKPEHKLNLAGLYLAVGREQQANDLIAKLVAADPANEDTRLKVASFFTSRNKPREAERELKDGIAKNGKSYKLRFALSELYLATSRGDQAIALLKECVAMGKGKDPNVINAKTVLARLYLDRNDTVQAGRYLDEVIKDNPKSVEAHFIKGNLYLMKGEGASAVAEFRTVVNENPRSLPGLLRLADAHMMNHEPNLALDSIKNAQKINPDSREALFALARYYAIQRDAKTAREQLTPYLEKNPNDFEARILLGDLLVAGGDLKGAAAEFGLVRKKAPQIPIGYVKTAEIFIRQGLLKKAVAEYELALKANPNSWKINNDLAVLLGDTSGNIDRALVLAEKARSLKPDEWAVQDTLGWLYCLKGDSARAVELLRPVQSKAPNAPVFNYHLGMALYKAGKTAEAKGFLSKALSGREKFNGREEAQRTLSRL